MSYIFNRVTYALAALGLNLVQNPAYADNEPRILNTLTVWEEATDTSSGTLNAEDIVKRQPTTLNELFSTHPETTVSGANRSAAQKVYARGVEETRLNVQLDGAKQGGSTFSHVGNMGIDPFMLKQVTVKGSGNALSGPGALGGSIKYKTKGAEDFLLPGENYGSMVRLSGIDNGHRLTPALATYGKPSDQFGYLLYASKSWGDNYADGHGSDVPYSDNKPFDGLIKLTLSPTDDQEIELNSNYREDDGNRASQLNFGVAPSHPKAAAEDQTFRRLTHSLSYGFNPRHTKAIDLNVKLYENDSTFKRNIDDARQGNWRTRGIDIRNTSQVGDLSLTYGYDFTRETATGKRASLGTKSEKSRVHGVYLQGDYSISPKWLVSGGVGFDHTLLKDVEGNRYDNHHVSPNLSFQFTPQEAITIRAAFSEAYRGVQPAPSMNLTIPFDNEATDKNLNGEVSRTAELNVDFNKDNWFAGLNIYRTKINDTILFTGRRGSDLTRYNGGDTDVAGATATLGYEWNTWRARLSYAHIRTEVGGEPVDPSDWFNQFSPQGDKIIFGLAYTIPKQNLYFDWTSIVVLDEKDLPSSYRASDRLEGYDVHDLSVVWQPTPRQEYTFAISNIFDEHYLDHSTPIRVSGGQTNLYEMGRSLRIGATIKF